MGQLTSQKTKTEVVVTCRFLEPMSVEEKRPVHASAFGAARTFTNSNNVATTSCHSNGAPSTRSFLTEQVGSGQTSMLRLERLERSKEATNHVSRRELSRVCPAAATRWQALCQRSTLAWHGRLSENSLCMWSATVVAAV